MMGQDRLSLFSAKPAHKRRENRKARLTEGFDSDEGYEEKPKNIWRMILLSVFLTM